MEARRRSELRCPVCGVGVLADIAYDERHPLLPTPRQAPESREVVSFSCGHEVQEGILADAARDDPNVERRQAEDVVDAGELEGGTP